MIEVRSPADGSLVGSVPELGEEAVRDAVGRARAAGAGWGARPVSERARILDRFRRTLADRADEAAALSARESGKRPFEALMGDVLPTLDLARFYARRVGPVMKTRRVRSWIVTKRATVEREPFGVVGVISPWNFPIVNPMRAVMAALVTGNTVVLKPSELSPLSALLMEAMARDAGFPEHVFQVVTGGPAAGRALIEAGVDKISFTGSVGVGRKVAQAAAPRLIPAVLELGGKNPMVVLADADLERAAVMAVQGAFWNAGQICISVERVYVEAPAYEAFVERVVRETRALRVGGRSEPVADIGAVTTQAQMDRLRSQVDDARSRGARVLVGGKAVPGPGRYFEPTVIADTDHGMTVMREESFGPLLPVMKVADADEALRLANDSPLALAASIWTRRRRGERLVPRLRAGMVSVNDVLYHGAVAGLPFGGAGDSGYGRVHGEDGLREMTRSRAVLVDRLGRAREPIGGFPFTAAGPRRARGLIDLLHGRGLRRRLGGLFRLLRRGG